MEVANVPREPIGKGNGVDAATLDFLHELLLYAQPEVIVEAGTYQGSFALIARAACPDAAIFTADVCKYQQHEGIEKVEFFWGDFVDMLKEHTIREIDFAFIDSGPPFLVSGEHKDSRLGHYELVKGLMAPGGIIATHDTGRPNWEGANEIIIDSDIQLNFGRGLSLRQL